VLVFDVTGAEDLDELSLDDDEKVSLDDKDEVLLDNKDKVASMQEHHPPCICFGILPLQNVASLLQSVC
jgi:hypothetical protein